MAKEYSGVKLDVTFTAASARENIISAENIALSFGKLAKWYTDFAWSAWTAPTVEVTGNGNAVTSASYGTGANANKLTLTKGSTFLTSDTQFIKAITSSGSGGAVTGMSVSSGTLTYTLGNPHPIIPTQTDTTSTASPDHGGTFTTVDSVTRDSNGHVTSINVKTVTLPSSVPAHTHNSLDSKYFSDPALLAAEEGNFFFSGVNLIANVNDWVGLQAGYSMDKFQLIGISQRLGFRQNDTGGSNTSGWSDWKTCLYPEDVTGENGITATLVSSTYGSGATAYVYNTGVKLGHTNSVTAVTNYDKPYVKYDAQGHVTESSYWMHKATGTGGTAGWVKVATMKHIKTYDNTPILLNVSQRGNIISYRIHMLWNNGDTKDPALKEFLIMSDHNWEAITPRAYLIKSTTSTWNLYILKLDNYENIAISMQPGGYFDDHMEWTWQDEQTAASAITGGTEATKKTYSTTDHTHAYLPLAGGTMDTNAEIIIPNGNNVSKLTYGSMNFKVGISGGWARGFNFYSDDFSTRIGTLGVAGSQNATAPDYMYFGKAYDDTWYRFYKTSCLISDADNVGFDFQYKPANLDSGYTGSFIQLKAAEKYGYGIIIGRRHGGMTMIGAGESANGLCNVIENSLNPWGSSAFGYGTENLYNISDASIYFISGANGLSTSAYTDWTDIKTALFDNNGYFRPSKDKNGQIGASNYRWNYGYFGTVDANTVNITNSAFGPLTITRSGATYGAGIIFKNSNGSLGSIGMTGSADGGLMRWSASGSTTYTVCDTGNTSVTQVLSSGTKIATIKIAGTNTDLYCQTNKYAFIIDNSENVASAPWHKFAEATLTANNDDLDICFYVSKLYLSNNSKGILNAHVRTGSNCILDANSTRLQWLVVGSEDTTGMLLDNFVMVCIQNSGSVKVELWVKIPARWISYVFKVLTECNRLGVVDSVSTVVMTASAAGTAAYTSGGTNFVSTTGSLQNTAASLSTDAGSNVTPVYFSSGIPVAVNKPASGAWFSTVPSVGSTGVIDIGRYIDFHSTDVGTTDYDVRLDASSTSLLTLSSNSGTPALRIAGTLPRLRFTQTTTGKSYDNAGVGIWCQPADTSGVNMFMQSHGNMMISSGEFCTNAYARKDSTGQTQVGYDNIVGSTSEKLYLGSDGEVQIISNGQNIATYSNNNHKVWTFETDGTLTTPGAIKDSLDNQHPMIQQNLRSSSNCVALTWWIVDGAASATTRPGIYYHNTGGDSTDKGAIILQPYHSSNNPWDSTHPIGLYIGKGILQLDGTNVSLEGHTHETLTCKSVDATTINNTAGCFFFKGNNLIGGINDWVGIQADAANDKFQLVANGASLMYRQNDTGGTNSTNWTDWVGLLAPSRVSTDTYLSAEVTTSTLGSGTTAFTYNSGVKISHKAYTAQSSGLYKITVDAAGHVSAATALTITPTPSSKTHTNWDTTAERAYLVTKGWMSYWNGAYNSSNASNLTYCNRGAFGTIVTKSDTDYVPNTTDGVNAAINLLTTETTVPTSDDDYYISQYASGGTTTTTYHRRPIVKLWQYMADRSIAFYYNGTADFASAPWAKVVSMKCASASSYRHIAFLVSKTHYNATDKYSWGILCIKFATNSSKNYDTASGVGTCDWLVAHGNIATTDFKITYTNTGTTSTTVDIWCKAGHRYASYVFKVLDDTMRGLSGAAYVGTSNIELFSVNGAGVAETSVTGTEITQTITTIANTSARANTVSGTLTNPTSATQYAIPFHSDTSTGAKTLRNNNGLQYKTLEGTASAEGYSALMVGNSTATGTAANKYGFLRLYSRNTSYVDLVAASTTTARTQTLSSMSGTLCCLNKNSTSYWGLYDGDGVASNWIRTTTYGFIPYQSGGLTSPHSALGTSTWSFSDVWSQNIHGVNLDVHNSAATYKHTITSTAASANRTIEIPNYSGTMMLTGVGTGLTSTKDIDTDTKDITKHWYATTGGLPSNTPVTSYGYQVFNIPTTDVDKYQKQLLFGNTSIIPYMYRYLNNGTWSGGWRSPGTGFFYVVGTQNAKTKMWTGDLPIPQLYDGLTIAFYLPYDVVTSQNSTVWDASSNTNVWLQLTLSNGQTTDWVPCYWTNQSRITTHFSSGATILLTYWSTPKINGANAAAPVSKQEGGKTVYWPSIARWTRADYNSNSDTKVNVTLGTTTKAYLLGTSTTPTSTAAAVTSIADTGVYLSTTAGEIVATTFNGTATKINEALTDNTTAKTYSIPFNTDPSTASSAGSKTLGLNSGLMYRSKEGTASAEGEAVLVLGNGTAKGTAGNKTGKIKLYTEKSSSYNVTIQPATDYNGSVTQFLPCIDGEIQVSQGQILLYNGTVSLTSSTQITVSGDGYLADYRLLLMEFWSPGSGNSHHIVVPWQYVRSQASGTYVWFQSLPAGQSSDATSTSHNNCMGILSDSGGSSYNSKIVLKPGANFVASWLVRIYALI